MVKGSSERSESDGVPESVMDSVNTTLSNLHDLKTHFHEFLSLSSDPHVLSQLPPLQRAQSLFFLAKITSTLLTCMYLTLKKSLLFCLFYLN